MNSESIKTIVDRTGSYLVLNFHRHAAMYLTATDKSYVMRVVPNGRNPHVLVTKRA